MKMYLDTSSDVAILKLDDKKYEQEFGYDMAEKLLGFLRDKLAENGADFSDILEITFMSGPGSFTGLRIGASIVNTLATELKIPIFDEEGKEYKVIIPKYGRPANVTPPRK